MQIFRKKYLYNSQNPIFKNQRVKTYNCMDTQTKNNRLLLLHHIESPPQVFPEKGVLQPIQFPSSTQPFSVYPLINCCSEIGKLNQIDAMYVLKCLVESKLKKPLYFVVSPDGIAASEVEGLLPERSPDLFNIALEILDLPSNLIEVQRSVVSRQGYAICRAIRDGVIDNTYFSTYGWKEAKKDNIKDDNFWIFKGRRKEEGPFNEEYGLAWHAKHGICRFKFIDLSKDAFEEDFQEHFKKKVNFYQNKSSKNIELLQIYKVQKDLKGIKILTSIANQGNLTDYITTKNQLNQKLTQSNTLYLLQLFIKMMIQISESQMKGYGALHIKNVYIHNNRITLGEPLFITDKMEKKLRDLKKSMDYFAPEFKENIILPEKLFNLNQEKLDIWSFGFLLHKMFTGEVPLFDAAKNPIIQKTNISSGMINLIKRCLNLDPNLRPRWQEINLRALQKEKQVQIIDQIKQTESVTKKSQSIRLDSSSGRSKKLKSNQSKQLKEIVSIKQAQDQHLIIKEQQAKLPIQEQQPDDKNEQKIEYYLPPEISSKLKRIKLGLKIIIIMVMYIFVFFGPFIKNSFNMAILKGYLEKTPLNLVDQTGNILSSTTILTAESKFFLFNDISFADVQNKYHCINDKFDPINNPNYSLYDYVTSSKFQALIYTGWTMAFIICCIKSISIWKGGISNRPRKPSKRYWVVYGFHQLSMASLLFAHFFIYQFFYFSGISPCFYIEDYEGVQPFFDSSLYLFLSNESGYMEKIFSSLCILSIILCVSVCFYAWGPKFDMKNFSTVPSITCRLIPYILLFLLCRIGVFQIFSPTALNDTTDILPSIIKNSAKGFFGIIPQIFILICVSIEVILEFLLYWCQQKASQSDSLSKMFNMNDKKVLQRNDSMTLPRNQTMDRNNSLSMNGKKLIRNNSMSYSMQESLQHIGMND